METNTLVLTLKHLFLAAIRDLKSSEVQARNSIASWVSKETSMPLKTLLHDYLDQVEVHIGQLGSFYALEDGDTVPQPGYVISACIDNTTHILSCCASPAVRDVYLLSAIQQINHYKICSYGTAAAFAAALGLQQAGFDLHQAGQDEKNMDERLSYLAEHELNKKAIVNLVI